MAVYALIVRGLVHELREADQPPSEWSHPAMPWVAVPDGQPVEQRWTYADGAFAAPVVDAAAVTALKALRVRAHRDKLLADSDWIRMPDATRGDVALTEAERAAWAAYRLALKTVPKQPGFPDAVTWPAAPWASA